MKTPDFMSYDRYKKKKKDNSKSGLIMFITTFFATLLLVTIIAKGLSPNVDVSIGDDSATDAKDTGLGVKKFIDERLKMIQMDDNGSKSATDDSKQSKTGYNDQSFDKYSKDVNDDSSLMQQVNDEPVKIPTKKTKNSQVDTNVAPPRPSNNDLARPFESPRTTKVLVGRYSTFEQAKVAQGILMDSGLNISPFVKNMGDYYTLQVGSYSSRATASSVASELQRNNFPARVVQE